MIAPKFKQSLLFIVELRSSIHLGTLYPDRRFGELLRSVGLPLFDTEQTATSRATSRSGQ